MSRKGLLLTLLLGACAGSPLRVSPQPKREAAAVKLMDGRPVTPHQRIREVQATSCAHDLGSEPDIHDARDQLKAAGARVGADVVGNIICQEESPRANHDCWKIARCTGDAFRTR